MIGGRKGEIGAQGHSLKYTYLFTVTFFCTVSNFYYVLVFLFKNFLKAVSGVRLDRVRI